MAIKQLKKVIAIKLARQPERLTGLYDLRSNFPRLATWVGWALLSPAIGWGAKPYKYEFFFHPLLSLFWSSWDSSVDYIRENQVLL